MQQEDVWHANEETRDMHVKLQFVTKSLLKHLQLLLQLSSHRQSSLVTMVARYFLEHEGSRMQIRLN